MLFSSLEFLYLFLPVAVGGYFLCPRSFKNAWLFAVSLIFYAYGEPVYILLMLATVLCDYLFGLAVERAKKRRRVLLTLAVVFNLALLGFFKYYDLLAKTLGAPTLDLPLPIGISFYTFQALSYVVDVYRGEVKAERSFISFGAYISLFPQLIAGPIVRYSEVARELKERTHSLSAAAEGIARFCVGLSKKVLLANGAGELSETLFEKGNATGIFFGLLLYAFQIYYDFSGYSDMAIGLGRIFGFRFPENFNYPYIARSITDFWRRWHMTLSSYFREYVYIPLGGNRKGRWRTYGNLFVVWSLTGLWHGAEWNFLLWGIYFFVILVVEKAFLLKRLERAPRAVAHVYAATLILVGWLIFSADGADMARLAESLSLTLNDGAETVNIVKRFALTLCDGTEAVSLVKRFAAALCDGATAYVLLRNTPYIIIMLVGVTPLPKRIYDRLRRCRPAASAAIRNALSIAALLLCTAYLTAADYNPFLYFRF